MSEEDYSKHVILAVPGKQGGQGGIIRQMEYLTQAWPQHSDWKLHWLQTWDTGWRAYVAYTRALLWLMWVRWVRGKAHLLHINLASSGSFYRKYVMARLARYMRLPYLIHLHGGGFQTFYDNASPYKRKAMEWMFYYAHHCVVLGYSWQHFLELRFRMPHEKITVCPNAVPEANPAPKAADAPHIMYLGHILPRKGMDELVLALSGLSDVRWRATIAGSGRINYYRQQIAHHGLQARVRFPGWLNGEAVEQQYSHADILVLPSHVENQPLAVLEAMARGVAVIATYVGTIPEMIEDGKTGLLVAPGDAAGLEQALRRLVEDRELRHQLAVAARAHFEEHFTLERYVRQWQAVYQQTLSG